jgi:curved DNA-binding protein CbpA
MTELRYSIVCLVLVVLLGFGCLSHLPVTNAQEQASQESTSSYIWRDYNFYQILGLEDPPPPPPKSTNNGATKKKTRIGDHSSSRNNNQEADTGPSRQTLLQNQSARRKLAPSDLKKAYRTQAQTWHPDKIQQKFHAQQQQEQEKEGHADDSNSSKKPSSSSSTNKGNSSNKAPNVEEATDRFALMSEAYQVLGNEEQKRDYDEDLAEEEMQKLQQRQASSSYNGGGGESWSDFFSDPWGAFDNFMSGGGDSGSPSGRHHEGQRPSRDSTPDSISEKTETYYDPYHGGTVYRIYRKEEWYAEGYFRILQQDFVLVDRGRYGGVSYESIGGGPTLTEEGYLHQQNQNNRYSQHHGQQRSNQPPPPQKENFDWMETPEYKQYRKKAKARERQADGDGGRRRNKNKAQQHNHVMLDLEYLTPESKPLQSQNGQYFAYVSDACEVTVVKRGDTPPPPPTSYYNQFGTTNEEGSTTVVWTSDSYYPPGICFLSLIDSQLVLLAGTDPGHVTSVLWTTPGDDDDDDETDNSNSKPPLHHYYLALEDEGVLAIYKTLHKDKAERKGRPLPRVDVVRHIQSLLETTTHAVCQATISNTASTSSTNNIESSGKQCDLLTDSSRQNKDNNNRDKADGDLDTCIWASASLSIFKMGGACSNVGRRMTGLSAQMRETSNRATSNLQSTYNDAVHYLHEDPRDIDAVDTTVRVVRDMVHSAIREQRTAMTLMWKRYDIWKRQLQHVNSHKRKEWDRLAKEAADRQRRYRDSSPQV